MIQNTKSQPIVLVIDDDDVNRIVLEKLFKKEKIKVLSAESGKQGLALAKAQKPDIVLLDIFMPGEDGFEVLEAFKSDISLKDIPVCIFSILEAEESKKKALANGAYKYITKPFNMKEVVEIVKLELS